MRVGGDPVTLVAFAAVMLCWLIFGLTFLLRMFKRPPAAQETRRNSRATVGLIFQTMGYALVWIFFRRSLAPIVTMPLAVDVVVNAIAVTIAIFSLWIAVAAVRVLGKQWAFAARLVEGHKLITEGPYSLVRNPIYLGMFGMLLATGLVATRWPALLVATVLFLVGTGIRVRSEETLLREQFGEEFDAYTRRVSALIPGLY